MPLHCFDLKLCNKFCKKTEKKKEKKKEKEQLGLHKVHLQFVYIGSFSKLPLLHVISHALPDHSLGDHTILKPLTLTCGMLCMC